MHPKTVMLFVLMKMPSQMQKAFLLKGVSQIQIVGVLKMISLLVTSAHVERTVELTKSVP